MPQQKAVLPVLEAVRQDARQAWRALRHSRRFAIWVVCSLAIGMAVAIAAIAFLNELMLGAFPAVHEQDRLVRVTAWRGCGRPDCWRRMQSPDDLAALREGLSGLQGLAAYTTGDVAVAVPAPRSMRSLLTSADYFDVLGVRPALGRTFDARDRDTHAPVAIISHGVWTREFGSSPSAIGRSILVAGANVEIVGVAPPQFMGIDFRLRSGPPEIWLPIWLTDRVLVSAEAASRRSLLRQVYFVGRLKDGIEVSQVQAEADVVARRLAALQDDAAPSSRADVRRVWRTNPDTWHQGILLVLPIPILVLVIACVNAANLMLARGSERQREIAIRLAIGAGRMRVVRQLLVESAVLALFATAVALPMAWWSLRLASNPMNIPIGIDGTVLALSVLTATLTTIGFGLAPALRAAAQPPSTALAPVGARSDALPRQSRLRRRLVTAQIALSLGLMATAWQLVATMQSQGGSGGTPSDRLLIARFDLEPLKLPAAQWERFYETLLAGAARVPGVEAAGIARHTAVWTFGRGAGSGSVDVWRPAESPDDGRVVIGGYAGGALFQALGLRVVLGRDFADADRVGRPQVAIVNQTFVEKAPEVGLGSVIRVAARNGGYATALPVRIVGVIEPAGEPRYSQDGGPVPRIYLPSPLEPEPALALYLRSTTTAAALASPIRQLVDRLDARVPISEIGSLAEFNERSFGPQMWLARAAAFLGVVGLLLATGGLYGVSSYVVVMRSREIAIRMALGARPRAILTMILGQSMRIALVGLVLGGAAAVVVSRLIHAEFDGIHALDYVTFGGSAALFIASMLLASAIPALRASRLDPVANLKDA